MRPILFNSRWYGFGFLESSHGWPDCGYARSPRDSITNETSGYLVRELLIQVDARSRQKESKFLGVDAWWWYGIGDGTSLHMSLPVASTVVQVDE
jgi:hypothetical protein